MKQKTLIKDMTTGNPFKQLIIFSLPFMLSNLLQQAYSLADMIIVGQFVGSVGLAATSNAGEIVVIFLFVAMGFTSAGQIIVSQLIGSGNKERLQSLIGTLFTLILLLGAAFTVVPLLLGDTLLRLINVPEEALGPALDYAVVCYWGNIPVFGYNAISAVLRGMGDSKHPTIFVIIAAVLNIGLDLLFVGPMGMGCFGAALATVISQCVAFIVSLTFVYRNRELFGFDFKLKSFAIDKAQLNNLISLGFPIALQSCLVSVSMLYVNSMINSYGVVAAAVTAVGNKITIAATICCGALNTAGSTIVGQNFAAGKFKRVGITLLNIMGIGLVFTAGMSLLLALFPEQIFGIFDSNPEVIAMSHIYVPVGVINLIGFASRSTAFAFINGIGFSKLAFVGGLIDGIVARIGLTVLFGKVLEMGVFGLWLGSAVAGHAFLFIGGFYFLFGKWKERKPITN